MLFGLFITSYSGSPGPEPWGVRTLLFGEELRGVRTALLFGSGVAEGEAFRLVPVTLPGPPLDDGDELSGADMGKEVVIPTCVTNKVYSVP